MKRNFFWRGAISLVLTGWCAAHSVSFLMRADAAGYLFVLFSVGGLVVSFYALRPVYLAAWACQGIPWQRLLAFQDGGMARELEMHMLEMKESDLRIEESENHVRILMKQLREQKRP